MLILSQMKEIQLFYFSAVNNNHEFDHDLITEDKYHHLNYIILVFTRQQAEFTSLKKANKNRFLTNYILFQFLQAFICYSSLMLQRVNWFKAWK